MRIFVGITDYDWFRLLSSKREVEEVNFWKPSPTAGFKALKCGEPFLFKLHSPRNFIAGGGFFLRFLQLPISLAWEAFGEGNGATSLDKVRRRIGKFRREPIRAGDDPTIGCILLEEPFFFDEEDWIPVPSDFSLNIVQGKGYDLHSTVGQNIWRQVTERLEHRKVLTASLGAPATVAAVEGARFGRPTLVTPRLCQGTFKALVTEAYSRRCVITAEKTLPALEAAHIKPYAHGGEHALANGLLLRSDLHRLFDRGYITVDPESKAVVVSKRIREEFENGRHYYALHGSRIAQPVDTSSIPSRENLLYHAENVFR